MILGEGAAAFVLESLESARERDAAIRGEVVGFAETSDAVHLTRPDSEGQARAMERARDDPWLAALSGMLDAPPRCP